MRRFLKTLAVVGLGVVGALLVAAPAFAGSISAPTGNPFAVPGDSSGNPQPFTVTVTGFTPGSQIFLEQCDGSDPTAQGWAPLQHCDLGSSPAAGTADASGSFTFNANNNNFAFHPFKGESPQSLFNCNAPGEAGPGNGLTDWTNCQLRASSSNQNFTADQAFLHLQLPTAQTPPPDTPEVPFAVILPIGAIAVGGGYFVIRKRRTARAAA